MKNKRLRVYVAVLLALLLTLTVPACTKRTQGGSATGKLDSPTYLAGETPSEEDSTQTEQLPTDTTDTDADSETQPAETEPTEAPTDEPTEAPTEAPTEPLPSLEYRSYGNGTCAVVGLGDVTDPYVIIPEKNSDGEIVTTVEAEAFKGCRGITVIQISSTVYSISEMAFADCSSLVHIEVDDSNRHYCDVDGVLFDMEQTRLMCYPPAKASPSLILPGSLKRIDSMSLYGCNNLKIIRFEGTVAQWAQIDIGEQNYGIYTASLEFDT